MAGSFAMGSFMGWVFEGYFFFFSGGRFQINGELLQLRQPLGHFLRSDAKLFSQAPFGVPEFLVIFSALLPALGTADTVPNRAPCYPRANRIHKPTVTAWCHAQTPPGLALSACPVSQTFKCHSQKIEREPPWPQCALQKSLIPLIPEVDRCHRLPTRALAKADVPPLIREDLFVKPLAVA